MLSGLKLKFILSGKTRRKHLMVCEKTHEAIRLFARYNHMTIASAAQYLLKKGLESVYNKGDSQ